MSEATHAALVFSDAEMKLLRERYKRLNDIEFDAFLSACRRYQLNPLANQIYARLQEQTSKNPRAVTYMTQIDGYRLIADRTGKSAGSDAPVYDREDSTPGKASVTVYKLVDGVRCAYSSEARWKEYKPGGNQDFMWVKMPFLMLGKCAEALALRKAFPAELSGLYTVDEMEQAEVDSAPSTGGSDNPYRDQQRERAESAKNTPAVKETKIDETTSAADLATLLTSYVGKYPIKENASRWKNIGVAAKAKLEASGWPPEHKQIVEAVLAGVRNQLRSLIEGKSPSEPEPDHAPPAEPATGDPAKAPTLERMTGWVEQQDNPRDVLNVLASLASSAKFADLRAHSPRMVETLDAVDAHAAKLIKDGPHAHADFEAAFEQLKALNQQYATLAQSFEAFGGDPTQQESA